MGRYNDIILKITEPAGIVMECNADKIIAESANGFFCILPNHVDMATSLLPGIVYLFEGDQESYVAVDEGLLVKCGNEVLISALHAARGDDLEILHEQMHKRYQVEQEQEEEMGVSFGKLEADLLKRFLELQKETGGRL